MDVDDLKEAGYKEYLIEPARSPGAYYADRFLQKEIKVFGGGDQSFFLSVYVYEGCSDGDRITVRCGVYVEEHDASVELRHCEMYTVDAMEYFFERIYDYVHLLSRVGTKSD